MLGLNYANLVDPVLKGLRTRIPAFAGMSAGQSVLDVCCGSGAQVFEYAAIGLKACGLDLSPEMLNLARRHRSGNCENSPIFYLADASSMPFEDNLFDYVSITLALHDKDKPLQDGIMGEMRRVVKKDGWMVLVDYESPAPHSILGALVKGIEFVAGGEHARNYSSYIQQGGLGELLSRHGLMSANAQVTTSGVFRMVLCRSV